MDPPVAPPVLTNQIDDVGTYFARTFPVVRKMHKLKITFFLKNKMTRTIKPNANTRNNTISTKICMQPKLLEFMLISI